MKYTTKDIEGLGVRLELSVFDTDGGVKECHAMMHVEARRESFQQQYARLMQAEEALMGMEETKGAKPVFKRYFLSDSTNQQPLMKVDDACTVSYIQQPPLDGSKVAVWIYLLTGVETEPRADKWGSTVVRHNGYEHIWTMGMTSTEGDSYTQTDTLLDEYRQLLSQHDITLADNCIRTWFFVRDVDTQYAGLVRARREMFQRNGLTPDTHYISSTGIGGNPSQTKALVQLGCYAMKGFMPEQQRYLYALTHLNRTIEYGVTFERGTLMQYADRNHAFISGTASIDNKGNVVHLGDVERQTERMLENVSKLLEEAGMTLQDAAQIIVYLRDTADYESVRQVFSTRFPSVPLVITLAPVCRPAWLIEMECIAVKESHNEKFRSF